MKTLTEFAAITLKNALAKKQELTTAGKTAEELPAALGEALKLEGDKLTFLLAALESMGEKTHDLKRVVVSTLAEGESAPSSARLIGEKYFTVEYYPPVQKAGQDRDAHGGRDQGRRDGKRGERGGRGGGGRGGDRGGRGGDSRGGGGGDRDSRGPRGPRSAPVSAGTGKLPVPNKTASLPVANQAAQSEPEKT